MHIIISAIADVIVLRYSSLVHACSGYRISARRLLLIQNILNLQYNYTLNFSIQPTDSKYSNETNEVKNNKIILIRTYLSPEFIKNKC